LKLSFYGADRTVTGSCHLVECAGKRILIDCGLYQGGREMEEESGYTVDALEKIGVIVPCPGYSEERLHLFYARLSQVPNAQRPDFDENLEPVAKFEWPIKQEGDSGNDIAERVLHDGRRDRRLHRLRRADRRQKHRHLVDVAQEAATEGLASVCSWD